MISAGDLYEWEDELKSAAAGRLRVMVSELVSDSHRLRHLIEEMADFRYTKQHDEQMALLRELNSKLPK